MSIQNNQKQNKMKKNYNTQLAKAEKVITLDELKDREFLHRVAGYSIKATGYYFFIDGEDKVKTFVTK